MRRTYLSLYYLVGYLFPAGLLLLLAPTFATGLLLSNQTYDEPPLRLAGLVLIALGILVAQIIRHRVEVMYTTTLIVRGMLSLGLFALFVTTGNPFFGVVLVIVLIGVALTGRAISPTGERLPRRRRSEPAVSSWPRAMAADWLPVSADSMLKRGRMSAAA
jgi:uncharacterized protein YjeT (DUF2065 family)